MKFIADFHIHSRFSRATSKELRPEELDYWAKIKGLSVVGTGDFTHPKWTEELKDKLEPAEPGLFKLKPSLEIRNRVLPAAPRTVRFVFSSEISCIYKKAGAVRKLHHLILSPSSEAASSISKKLARIGNINSDGRPILGIDSKHLLEIVLEAGQGSVLIPAHIWTPWFSLFGSMSGFDSIEECFEDLTKEIFALETGLSSDPAMNWRLSALDRFSLVSNSDAHSAKNLAREANLFNCDMDYNQMIGALRNPGQAYLGTVEFFPEEGKYHFDGHRKCDVRLSPEETKKHKGICPVCHKPVTVGVMNRVDELADRSESKKPARAPGFKSLIPLAEVIAEILGTGSQSKAVEEEYFRLVRKLGPELDILMEIPGPEIDKEFPLLGTAIQRMREGKVTMLAGFDGEYGVISVFEEAELRKLQRGQSGFFAEQPKSKKEKKEQVPKEKEDQELEVVSSESTLEGMLFPGVSLEQSQSEIGLDPMQSKAVEHKGRALLIKAGPGTGKTRTLTHRIAHLVETGEAKPEEFLALTFTNQAGQEMRERLENLLGEKAHSIFIGTFHSFAWKLIRENEPEGGGLSIIDQDAREALLSDAAPELKAAKLKKVSDLIRRAKMQLLSPEQTKGNSEFPDFLPRIYRRYQSRLASEKWLDFDDLILNAAEILSSQKISNQFTWIFVDEYQDLDFAQYQMVKLLAGAKNHLCVIGDPDQAIYGFRGASPEFFDRFLQDFPEAKVIELERSFRSSEQILKASTDVLASRSKAGLASGMEGPKLKIIELATERAEAEFAVHEIEKLIGGTGFFSFDSARVKDGDTGKAISFSDIAVLFRAGSQISALAEAFSRSGIPYRLLSESPLQSRFFKAGLRLLRLISSQASPLATRLALKDIFQSEKNFPIDQKQLKDWLIQRRDDERAEILIRLLEKAQELSALETCEKVFSLADAAESETAEKDMVRELAVDLVKRKARQTGTRTPEQILEVLTLASSQDFYDPDADRVSLLTIHSAKGLEFEVVFIVGCEEGIIPHISARTEQEIEEEKRLFYVALTRAKNLIYLSRAKKRLLFGKTSEQKSSRFLNRIERELLDQIKPERLSAKPKERQLGLFDK